MKVDVIIHNVCLSPEISESATYSVISADGESQADLSDAKSDVSFSKSPNINLQCDCICAIVSS